jgi:hypothetical protein
MARRWVQVDCGCGRRIGRVLLAEGVDSSLSAAELQGMVGRTGRWGSILGRGMGGVEPGTTMRLRCPGCRADTRVQVARFGRAWLLAWQGDRVMVADPSGRLTVGRHLT